MGIDRNSLPASVRRLVNAQDMGRTIRPSDMVPSLVGVQLPYPPTVNHYWGTSGTHRYLRDEGKRFRERVCVILAGCRQLRGNVALTVEVHPPDKRRRDLDNVLKAILDALEHAGAMRDDSQVAALHVWRRDTWPPAGCVMVTLTEQGSTP